MDVNGVRNSWETAEMKSDCMRMVSDSLRMARAMKYVPATRKSIMSIRLSNRYVCCTVQGEPKCG
jgi:hypothetical protein